MGKFAPGAPPDSEAIQMSTGKFFIVSPCDFNELSVCKWMSNGRFPFREIVDFASDSVGVKTKRQFAHEAVAQLMANGRKIKSVKHRTHNSFDNRRDNLIVMFDVSSSLS